MEGSREPTLNILRDRLRNQRLIASELTTAHDIVQWMGAVQSQEYGGAKWAVAQRSGGLTSAALDAELQAGAILRTHVLRPTWHFVTPEDIRWMLAITAPRLRPVMEYGNRQSGLTDVTIGRSLEVIARSLSGGRRLTRSEIGDRLLDAGIKIGDSLGLLRVMLWAEVEGVVCSGGLRGKQHTYALLDEVVPAVGVVDRDAVLPALARRYFASHGPATAHDFAWWAGLSLVDARAAIRSSESALDEAAIGEQTYWFVPYKRASRGDVRPRAHILPNFDEYTVAYRDRRLVLEDPHQTVEAPFALLGNLVIVNGRVLGTWKRVLTKNQVVVTLDLFRVPASDEVMEVRAALDRYARFLELPLKVDAPGF